jgi:hypothetical protein
MMRTRQARKDEGRREADHTKRHHEVLDIL